MKKNIKGFRITALIFFWLFAIGSCATQIYQHGVNLKDLLFIILIALHFVLTVTNQTDLKLLNNDSNSLLEQTLKFLMLSVAQLSTISMLLSDSFFIDGLQNVVSANVFSFLFFEGYLRLSIQRLKLKTTDLNHSLPENRRFLRNIFLWGVFCCISVVAIL